MARRIRLIDLALLQGRSVRRVHKGRVALDLIIRFCLELLCGRARRGMDHADHHEGERHALANSQLGRPLHLLAMRGAPDALEQILTRMSDAVA